MGDNSLVKSSDRPLIEEEEKQGKQIITEIIEEEGNEQTQ